jgi:hypothetical protein
MNQSAQLVHLVTRSASVPVPLIALTLVAVIAFGVYRFGQHCRACGYIECAEHLHATRPGRRR